jgi:2-keto-4-pentenoate hydratase/2-oxohepta-3-ene-1,7-dioic acid hydratase in catechol pathway
MKICRFQTDGKTHFGVIDGDRISECDEALNMTGRSFLHDQVGLLAPVQPSKIVCVGRNYAEHAKELGNEVPTEPLLFLKAPSTIIFNGETIVIPSQSNRVEHEGELAVVIGRDCKDLSDDDDPFRYVLGFTCLDDVTARDIQRSDVQFTRGKSFDTFCPIGPHIETDLDVSDLRVTTKVNGVLKQDARTSQMVFPAEFLIRYISRQMTLKAGDVIATGTPSGVSKMEAGDVCDVTVEGIGSLTNPIAAQADAFVSTSALN